MSDSKIREPSFLVSLLSGGVAGTTVDVALYPLDTIKTRLQSSQGFIKAGGFRGVYKGLSAAAVGSAPGAALFFSTYEMSKQILQNRNNSSSSSSSSSSSGSKSSTGYQLPQPAIHMLAASIGETVSFYF
jgi:solute carrier family 25 S-adenosylmethionine transporter 26